MTFLQRRFLGVRLIVLLLAAYWLAIFTGTHVSSPPAIAESVSDKTKHFGAYLGLTVLLCEALLIHPFQRRLLVVAAMVTIYGILDETTQGLVPSRQADPYDLLADLGGLATGILVFTIGNAVTKNGALH